MLSISGTAPGAKSPGPVVFVESNLTGYNAYAVEIARGRGLPTNLAVREPSEYHGMRPDILAGADSVDVVDTFDVGKLTHHAARVGARALVAVDDYRLAPTAAAAAALGLPHADVAGLVNTHFKDRARALCDGIGSRVGFEIIDRETSFRRSPLGYPCVVKPLDDSGSTGVTVCADDQDFGTALARAQEVRTNLRGYECSGSLLVEEYVAGEEFTAECIWDNVRERWQLLGYTRKLLGPPPSPVETGAMFPHWFTPALDARIEATVYDWLAAVGHRHGSAHVEFKVRGDDIHLIEINPRLGGDQIRDLIRLTGGVDPIEMYLDLALGNAVEISRVPDTGTVATSFYKLPPRVGRIVSVTAPRDYSGGIVRHSLSNEEMNVSGVRDNDDRLGYVISVADSPETSLAQAEEFMDGVDVEYAS